MGVLSCRTRTAVSNGREVVDRSLVSQSVDWCWMFRIWCLSLVHIRRNDDGTGRKRLFGRLG